MAEEFRDCFVGDKGYDAVKKLMKNGNDFCRDLAKCLQDRNEAEMLYVRALRKSGESLDKLAGRAKGSLTPALKILATQTTRECDAHNDIADILLREISIPMKNLAETQSKDMKGIEESLNGKFKEWNAQTDTDNKYRSRQFEKSKEIETLNLKTVEMSKSTQKSTKDSAKESILSTPLVMSCVKPGGRYNNNSEKLELTIKKAEDDLKTIETKYYTSTRNVEIARQACDAEMCRSCDQMQKMELDRITEMGRFIEIFANSMYTLTQTMNQVSRDLNSIHITPRSDIIIEARSNTQPTETNILLYDIYAQNLDNVMADHRRKLSLMSWMDILRKDIAMQRFSNNTSLSSVTSASSLKTVQNESPDDDRDSASDGAMCSTSSHSKRDTVVNPVDHSQDGLSSSSSNDDDGAMRRTKSKKREKKKTEGHEKFSTEKFIDRHGAHLLQCLYEASLYKIEYAYNRMQKLAEPQYQYSQSFATTCNDKGYPTTFLRVPFEPSTYTPPSAPVATGYFVQSMPMFSQPQQLMTYAVQSQAPSVGWTQDLRAEHTVPAYHPVPRDSPYSHKSVSHDRVVAAAPLYSGIMTRSTESSQQNRPPHVRARFPFKAKHDDELSFKTGDIIVLMESRKDGWCKGNFDGQIGLFPGNYVENVE